MRAWGVLQPAKSSDWVFCIILLHACHTGAVAKSKFAQEFFSIVFEQRDERDCSSLINLEILDVLSLKHGDPWFCAFAIDTANCDDSDSSKYLGKSFIGGGRVGFLDACKPTSKRGARLHNSTRCGITCHRPRVYSHHSQH